MARARFATVAAIAWLSVAAACFGVTEPVEVMTWEAVLTPPDGMLDPVTGSAAMVIGEVQTQIGISVRLAPPNADLGWALRAGSCAAPGERVGPAGIYPAIEVDADGEGEAETVVNRRIATAGPYAAIVYENGDGTGTVLACGDLEPTD